MIDSKNMNDLHPALKRGAEELIRRMQAKGYKVGVNSTYRDAARQNVLFAQGRTTSGSIVTQSRGGESMHNYRLAFDIYKDVKGQEYSDSVFFRTAGQIWTEMGGEWGGNWTGFVDTPHFQFTNGLNLSQLQKGQVVPANAKMKWELQSGGATAPATQSNKGQYKVINVKTTLNIRSSPSMQASVVGSLKNGAVINVTEIKNNFAKMSKGWVSITYLKKI